MSPQEAARYLVDYQNVQGAALPPSHESGIFPAPDWSMQTDIRFLYTFVTKSFDALPPPDHLMVPEATGVTEAMRRIAKTGKQAIKPDDCRQALPPARDKL